jgi:hypothetical protein
MDWLKKAIEEDAKGDFDVALDIIYDEMDDAFCEGRFDEIDSFLKELDDVTDLSVDILMGLLTTSKWAEDKLPSRKEFAKKAVIVLKSKPDYHEIWTRYID